MGYLSTVLLTITTVLQLRFKLKKLKQKEDYRLIRITVVMLSVFTACTLPIIVSMIYRKIKNSECNGFMYFIGVHFIFVNCGMNCIVYSLMSKYFRRSLIQKWPFMEKIIP